MDDIEQDHIDAAAMSLEELVAAKADELSPTERRVTDHLLAHPQDVIFQSALQIAHATRTSDATVIRTARELGFSGLPELKHALGAILLTTTHPASRLASKITVVRDSTPGGVLATVGEDAVERIEETVRQFDADAFAKAMDLLDEAGTVAAFGVGLSHVAADYLATRLVRLGIRAEEWRGMGFALADDLMRLREGDVVVLFAPGRFAPEVQVIVEHAAKVGATSVLVTDSLHVRMGEQVDVVLHAPMSASRMSGELLTSSIVCDALVLGLARRSEARATASSKALTSLRTRLTGRKR